MQDGSLVHVVSRAHLLLEDICRRTEQSSRHPSQSSVACTACTCLFFVHVPLWNQGLGLMQQEPWRRGMGPSHDLFTRQLFSIGLNWVTEWLSKGLVSAGSDALFCLDFRHAILNGCSHVVKRLSWGLCCHSCAVRLQRKIWGLGCWTFSGQRCYRFPDTRHGERRCSKAQLRFILSARVVFRKWTRSVQHHLHTSGLCLSQNTGANSKGSVLKLGTHWNYCIATILAARPAGLRSFSDDIVFLHLTMAFLADECLAMSSVFRTPNWIWDKASLTPKWCWMILNEWCWIHIDILNQDWIMLNSLPTSSQWFGARSEWRGTVVVDCSWLVFLCRENALLRCLCSFHPPRSWTLATKLHLKIFLELKLQVEPVISRTSTLCSLWVRLLSLLLWMNSFARTWHRSLPQWTWELCKDQALCSHMLMSPTGIIATCMSLGLTLSDSMFCHRKRDLFALHVISFCLQSLSVFLPVHPVALCACVPVGPCRTGTFSEVVPLRLPPRRLHLYLPAFSTPVTQWQLQRNEPFDFSVFLAPEWIWKRHGKGRPKKQRT